ncbi:hypothetical protein BaRGS_00014565, partial [Batillaria attramentaria]
MIETDNVSTILGVIRTDVTTTGISLNDVTTVVNDVTTHAVNLHGSNNHDVTVTDVTINDVISRVTQLWGNSTKWDADIVEDYKGNFSSLPIDPITLETQQLVSKFHTVLLIILVLIAIPANCINMVAFFRQGLKERINLCLFILSLDDLLSVMYCGVHKLDAIMAALSGVPQKLLVDKLLYDYYLVLFYSFIYLST